jgi:hypothetical protein
MTPRRTGRPFFEYVPARKADRLPERLRTLAKLIDAERPPKLSDALALAVNEAIQARTTNPRGGA